GADKPVTAPAPNPGGDAAQYWADASTKTESPIAAATDDVMGWFATLGSNEHIAETASTLATAGLLSAGLKIARKIDELTSDTGSEGNSAPVPSVRAEGSPSGKRTFSKADRDAGFEKAKDVRGVPRCQYCNGEITREPGRPDSY